MIHFGKPRPGGPQLPPPQIGGEEFAAARIYQQAGPAFDDPQPRTMAAPVPGREREVMIKTQMPNNLPINNENTVARAAGLVGAVQEPQQYQAMSDQARAAQVTQNTAEYGMPFAQRKILEQLGRKGPKGAEPIERLGALAMKAGLG